jgi:hypothetical protein
MTPNRKSPNSHQRSGSPRKEVAFDLKPGEDSPGQRSKASNRKFSISPEMKMRMDPSSAVLKDNDFNLNDDLMMDQRQNSYLPSPENVRKRKNLNILKSPTAEEDKDASGVGLGGSPIGKRNIQIYGANIIKLTEMPKPKKMKRMLSRSPSIFLA